VLPANRRAFTLRTSDGLNLIGEVSSPLGQVVVSLLCLHPNPAGGGMMDSHIYKKAANRLPELAGIEIIRPVKVKVNTMRAIARSLMCKRH